MKRVLIFIIAFVYLTTSSVAAVTMHYCMGKMFAVNFSDNNKCDKCGMQHAKGCCESKVKILKAQDSHQLTNTQANLEFPVAISHITYHNFNTSFSTAACLLNTRNNSPPHLRHSLNILFCVFRI